MAWHGQNYPGRLALLTSGHKPDRDEFLDTLLTDFAAWQAAHKELKDRKIVESPVDRSPFQK
eukprot:9351287-Prorocentrum_lima.AAC.1